MKLHVVLLEKKASLHHRCFSELCLPEILKKTGEYQTWISMGHFDAAYTYSLPLYRCGIFDAVAQNNRLVACCNNGERYFHPLYLVSDRGDSAEEQEDQTFWSDASHPFLAVARIHFHKNTNVNTEYDTLVGDLDRERNQHAFTFRLYYTVELSDAILAIKGHCLHDILAFTLKLRRFPYIGKVYTYCAINHRMLMDCSGWQLDENDRLPLCTVRFAVSSFPHAIDEIKAIPSVTSKAKGFSITGVDDLVVRGEQLPVSDLIALYQRWFSKEGKLATAFDSIITRLGVDFPTDDDWPEAELDEDLIRACDKLMCYRQALLNRYSDSSPAWIPPLLELTTCLLRMSRTALLDEFVYLMLPGVRAFLMHVQVPSSKRTDSICNLFIESWADILEHTMRTESQLTHNPELRPMLYDIPVALLEYTLAFLDEAGSVLQRADKDKKHIAFFLRPRLCQRIEAEELFQPSGIRPGLVLVTLPFNMLYDVQNVQIALAHEISHFVGETCRARIERYERYAYAVAALASRAFFLSNEQVVIDVLFEMLKNSLKEETVMKEMEKKAKDWVLALFSDIGKQRDLLIQIVNKASKENMVIPPLSNFFGHRQNLDEFQKDLHDLSMLFRECYADLCMLHLLTVDQEQYIQNLMDDLRIQHEGKTLHYEQVAIRIFVTLTANGSSPSETLDRVKYIDQKLGETLERIISALDRNDNLNSNRIPLMSVLSLQKYVITCKSLLRSNISREDCEDLRGMYKNVISLDIKYAAFLDAIDQYRIHQLRA